MTTATKSRKSVKPARHVTIGIAVNGTFAIHMSIGVGEKAKHFGYYVRRIPADFGLGFHFEKFGAEQEEGKDSEYDVNIDLQSGQHSCTCKGNTYCGHCKHVESVLALIQSGKLETDKPEPKTAMSANDFPQALRSMPLGSVQQIHGHRVERVACGWVIDERFASAMRPAIAALLESKPCQRVAIPAGEFEDL